MGHRGVLGLRRRVRWMSWMGWMTLLGAFGPIACVEPIPDSEETSPDDEDVAEGESAIFNGQPNDGSAPTVGVFSFEGQPRCTATQVSCNAVLTAAHCVRHMSEEDEQTVRELNMEFTLTDQARKIKIIGYKSFGRPTGPDDIALLRLEHGCGPQLMYPPLAAALPGAGAQLTTWGESCDLPLRAAMLPWEREFVRQLGSPTKGSTSAKRFRKTLYDPAWPQDSTEGNFWTVYPGRIPGHHYGKAIGCKGDSGGPTFAAGEIAFVSSNLLVMGSIHYPENGNPPNLTYFVDGIGFAEVPKWRAQLMDKISEWSYYCGSADSGTSSGSASDSGSSGGSGGSGSSLCLMSYGSPPSGPFTDEMPLSASGTWVGNNWLSFTGPGSNDTFTELCVLDGSGTLGVGSECQSGGNSGSGGGYGDSGSGGGGGSGSGYGYGDSSSGGGGSGSGYGYGDSSSGGGGSGSGYGYGDSSSGGGGSGSGYGYGDSSSGGGGSGSGYGYGDSSSGGGGSGSGYGYGDSGSGYSSGDSSYSDSGYGYCVDSGQGGGCSDSGSGDGQGDSSYSDSGSYGGGDSGSGGGYGDSGSGGGYGDSGSGGAGGEAGDGGDGGGGGGT